jgi:hypothetical protein
MAARPRASQRMLEGLARLRHNTDFAEFKNYLEAELAYTKSALVYQLEGQPIGQLQGRAQQLAELLKHISEE